MLVTKRCEFLTPEGREMTDDEILQKWENSKIGASNRDPWNPEFKQFLDFYVR